MYAASKVHVHTTFTSNCSTTNSRHFFIFVVSNVLWKQFTTDGERVYPSPALSQSELPQYQVTLEATKFQPARILPHFLIVHLSLVSIFF